MFTIDDFDNFEVCAVVSKTSETGIMTNQRLLVIKAGILYYHSKVPANFNNNLQSLASLSNIPKCSIFTPHLKTIKIDPKSNTILIITFLNKDLKEKQELTKRASTIGPYQLFQQKKPQVKGGDKIIQWKLKFNSNQRCKQWSKYLQQLKEHYGKKIEQDQGQMYERFLQGFNEDKKKNNQLRRSEAFTSKSLVLPPVSSTPSNLRQTQVLQPNISNNKLGNINENLQQEDSVSEQDNKNVHDNKPVETKQQKINGFISNKLFEDDQHSNQYNQILKQSKEQIPKIPNLRHKESNQIINQKQISQRSVSEKNSIKQQIQQNYDNQSVYSQSDKELKRQQQQRQKQLQRQRQIQREQQRQRQAERKRLDMIEFARKRQRQMAERQKRQEQERKLEQKRKQQLRKEQEQIQKNKISQSLSSKLPAESQNIQMTENILGSETQKSESSDQDQNIPIKRQYNQRLISNSSSIINIPQAKFFQQFQYNNISESHNLQTSQQSSNFVKTMKISKNSIRKKSVDQILNTTFMKFIDYHQQLFKQKFQQRIEKQTEFLKYIVQLRQQAREIFESIVNEFNSPFDTRQYKLVGKYYRTDRFVIEFAFCQTKTITLYNGQQTFFNQSSFKELKDKFQIYNQIHNNILLAFKKKQKVSFRVPFNVLIQYKGVMGLIMVNDFLTDSDTTNFSEISNHLSGEAALIIPQYLLHNFKIFKVYSSNKYIIEIETVYHEEKSLEQKYSFNLSKPIDLLRKYRYPTLQKAKQLLEKSNQLQIQDRQNLEILIYTYYVRSLYRSGQGQIDGKDFFSLILSLNPQYGKLLDSQCPQKYHLKGLFCQYINQLCGVSLQLGQMTGNQDLLLGNIRQVTYQSIIKLYEFANLEVFALIDGFQQFSDKQFAFDILKLWKIYSYRNQQLDEIYSIYRIITFFKTKKYSQGLQQIQILRSNLRYTHPLKMRCYELLLNYYHTTNKQKQFINCIHEAQYYIEFTFGRHSSLLTLYCILAQFLNHKGNKEQTLNIYNHLYNMAIPIATHSRILTQIQINKSSVSLNSTNKETIQQTILFTLNLAYNKTGMIKMKVIRFLAYLYYLSGKQQQAINYIQQAIDYFDNSQQQLIQCYMLASMIWNNNLTKQKQIINKVYLICKNNTSHLNKLSELIKRFLNKVSLRSNIEINYLKNSTSKQQQFSIINERIQNQNIVNYLETIINKILQQEQAQEISQVLQFAYN